MGEAKTITKCKIMQRTIERIEYVSTIHV